MFANIVPVVFMPWLKRVILIIAVDIAVENTAIVVRGPDF